LGSPVAGIGCIKVEYGSTACTVSGADGDIVAAATISYIAISK
jgi:hypothetical protein